MWITFGTGKSDGMEKLSASQSGGEKQLKNSPGTQKDVREEKKAGRMAAGE